MKIIFMLPMGQVQYEIPEAAQPTFNFINTMAKLRMDGYFMADNLYLRHDTIIGACMDKGDTNIIQFPHPPQPSLN